jgi:tetratricopeptide (TPR) repeat protein
MRLGQLHSRREEYHDAINYLEQSIQEYKQTGELFGEGFAYNYYGDALIGVENWSKAYEALRTAMSLFEKVNAKDRIANVHHSFGTYYFALKEYDKAKDSLLQAIRIRSQVKTYYYVSKSLNLLCEVNIRLGLYQDTQNLFKESQKYSLQYNDYFELSRLYSIEAQLAVVTNKFEEASELFVSALVSADRYNDFRFQQVIQRIQEIYYQIKDVDERKKILSELHKKIKTKKLNRKSVVEDTLHILEDIK